MIQFEGREVIYDYTDLKELGLAWSISIHKSQGLEYPVVILPLYMQHYLGTIPRSLDDKCKKVTCSSL
jgi:exodeoxyribonuclease V alpha subunit